jgi:predicted permease
MGDLLQDVRYGIRTLLKSPGFTLVAVIALALGIGANTAMFGIVNAVLLRPVPYPQPDRLLKLYSSGREFARASVSYLDFLDWQQRSRAFQEMAAYRTDNFNLTGQANPERLAGAMASARILSVLGVRPIVGRTFTDEEDRRGASPVAVVTSTLWKTRFAGDPAVVGSRIMLNGLAYTVIGVVPADDMVFRRVSVIVPIGQWSEPLFWQRGVSMGMRVVGRLKPGVTPRQAQSELEAVAAALAREYPKENKDQGIFSLSLREDLVGDVRTPLLVLLAGVGFVLLIACANVANLLLARAAARRREFAVRGALGACPSRLVRQLLAEGLLLALAGGALGLVVGVTVNAVFVSGLDALPRGNTIRLDVPVLAFTALISLVACLAFGAAPALHGSRSDMNAVLREGARGSSGRQGLQRGLVVVEVALALMLAASAGLMVRTMWRLGSVDPGFDPHNVVLFGLAGSPAVHGTPVAIRNGFAETSRQLRSVPGVSAASVLVGSIPMLGDSSLPYWVEGRPKPPEQSQMDKALFYGVEPEYFSIMRIPLLRGRLLNAGDNESAACAIDVDEEFARRAFPAQDPLGQRVSFDLLLTQCEIVGVVGHVKQWGLDTDATSNVRSQMYVSFSQFPDSVMDLVSTGSAYVVRSAGDPHAPVPALKRAINRVNGNMVMFGEQSMEDVIDGSLGARRFTRLVLAMFAGLALVLAAVGIYGVMSHAVSQSVHEIGVRQALGAGRREVLAMVLGGAVRLAVVGIVIGGAGALAATRAMKGLLFGVTAADPVTFVAVSLMLLMVTVIASCIPAWRATRVDPIVALRCE